MKYKVGDKFIIEITKVIRGTSEYKYLMNNDERWSERWMNKLHPYEEPKPERIIKNCLFCENKCRNESIGSRHYVVCNECQYMSAECDTEQEANKTHNELYRKLNNIK